MSVCYRCTKPASVPPPKQVPLCLGCAGTVVAKVKEKAAPAEEEIVSIEELDIFDPDRTQEICRGCGREIPNPRGHVPGCAVAMNLP